MTGTSTACAIVVRERELVAVLGAVAVHAREQDLPRAALDALLGPRDRVLARGGAAAGDVGLIGAVRASLGVDRQHHALRAEDLGELVDQLGPGERRGVDRDLVRARVEDRVGVLDRAHAAADRERHEDVIGGSSREFDDGGALVGGRGDVEEDQLVGALRVVVRGKLDGVPGVADVDELRALDDPAVVDVHAGNHALVVHALTLAARASPKHRIFCLTLSALLS